ncbi:cell division cycle protein 21 [Dermatophagoides pteronyssinus]|uniref:Cell division cycle 5-like protein n=1 Tax=Dermatophagoides pteronyssinus TaxID=6956 RepID=A0A6P6YA46_DERPT|nr:cell division cycle 5-like protein [Dermatophagoides pteronyssinus]
MGRILIKGGVWRNTEDEILKAAVMKYGKNQWSRIASLLHRKSAKQCKARWYEWLDPSIKKTEWSREEEEKLINLVRLMPTQWRTIASIVGRTASQCLEHYEQLLDQVQNKDKNAAGTSLDDPRKLKPGEIDPNPETKPARPDPKDMDEDELEMLSEARARLANTQGKKAKRKAREKQLEEARRLAQLQKRRELRMAGINLHIRNWKHRRHIDYNGEVPFEKTVPAGFHDTSDDSYEPGGLDFKRLRQQQLEGELPSVREERERKKDKEKLKKKKENGIPSSLNIDENEFQRPRSKLVLPEPAISDQEIEQVVKLGRASELAKDVAEETGNIASETLLADYSITSSAVNSIRTPKTAAFSRDNIMAEAKNLLALQNVDTPLLGGQNAPLIDVGGQTPAGIRTPAGFTNISSTGGATGATPNTMISTPYRSITSGPSSSSSANNDALVPLVSNTPGTGNIQDGFTPLSTPVRDKLSINPEESLALEAQQDPKQYTKTVKENLRKAFSKLPQPKNEYEIVLNNDKSIDDDDGEKNQDQDGDDNDNKMIIDQSEIDAESRKREQDRIMNEQKWTQAVRRNLPRPCDVRATLSIMQQQQQQQSSTGPLSQAEDLIRQEMIKILHFDALMNPTDDQLTFAAIKSKTAKSESKNYETQLAMYLEKNPIEPIENEYLLKAKQILNDEISSLKNGMEHDDNDLSVEDMAKIWDECYSQLLYLPAQNRYTKASMVSKRERIESIESRLEQNRRHMTREAKKAGKIEKKLSILLGGYHQRSQEMSKQFLEYWQQIEQSHLELYSFKALKVREDNAIEKRLEQLKQDVKRQEERERSLQARYAELLKQHEELQE